MPAEGRFKWQDPINDFDAFYSLPSTIDHKTAVFGSSTRSDWENTWMNKKDGMNPNAGPGQNGTPNDRQLSDYPNPATVKFGHCVRPDMSAEYGYRSPGPKYDLEGVFKHGKDTKKLKIGFNKDHRKPLYEGTDTDAQYFPQLRKGLSVTMAGRRKEKKLGLGESQSPGAIYNMQKYCFGGNLTSGDPIFKNPSFSFGKSRAPRFSYESRFSMG